MRGLRVAVPSQDWQYRHLSQMRAASRVSAEMIRLALFLLPYAPRQLRPWLMGIAFGRKPEPMEWRDGKWRLPLKDAASDSRFI